MPFKIGEAKLFIKKLDGDFEELKGLKEVPQLASGGVIEDCPSIYNLDEEVVMPFRMLSKYILKKKGKKYVRYLDPKSLSSIMKKIFKQLENTNPKIIVNGKRITTIKKR